jgi:hypothetical protein
MMDNKPDSLCTLSTKNSIKDLVLLLTSLNYISNTKPIYIVCDSFTKDYIEKTINNYQYKIKLFNILDNYKQICLGTQFNIQKKEWTEFMLEKTKAINYALEENTNTLFIDSDIMFLSDLPDINKEYELGLCEHNILESIRQKYGKYNGGSLWINTPKFSSWWIENTLNDSSKYMEQQCLDDAPDAFKTFYFPETHNYGWWRLQTNESEEIKNRRRKFKITNGITLYNRKQLISIHTHFYDNSSRQVHLFNKFVKTFLNEKLVKIINDISNIEIKTDEYDLISSNSFYCQATITYPPFKNGVFLEEYFLNYVIKQNIKYNKSGRQYIPALWTNFQNQSWFIKDKIFLQEKFNDWVKKNYSEKGYFVVIQHDDGPQLKLPNNTLVYGSCTGDIPLPLIYEDNKMILKSVPKKTFKEKEILCSFIGSNTHKVREIIENKFIHNKLFVLTNTKWSSNINQNQQDLFINTTINSKFALAPRGYGKSSFRFFEIFKLGTIPIYVWDDIEWLPYKEIIDYSKFCISINISQIDNLENILCNVDEEKYNLMLKEYEEHNKYFELEYMCEYIMNS